MLGFVLVVLGSFSLALQNVLLRVIFVQSSVLGWFSFGGFLTPSLSHSLLLLQMRSILIFPLILFSSLRLRPSTLAELKELAKPTNRALLLRAVGSSGFLFLAMASLFVALSKIPAGIAVTLFFIHPAITVLLSWRFFGDRPTRLRWIVLVIVFSGSLLLAPNLSSSTSPSTVVGVGTAVLAGVFYSLQGLTAQTCMRQIHPVPFTVINFTVMAVLSSLSLLLITIEVSAIPWAVLWKMSLATAVLTLLGQLFYNIGIHLANAAIVSIIAVSNPAFTALLAWLGIQEVLQPRQIVGIALISLGVACLGLERKLKQQEA